MIAQKNLLRMMVTMNDCDGIVVRYTGGDSVIGVIP